MSAAGLIILLNAQGGAVGIKLHHAVPLRVAHGIGKHGAAIHAGGGGLQLGDQLMSIRSPAPGRLDRHRDWHRSETPGLDHRGWAVRRI